jgi:hypothetical protein
MSSNSHTPVTFSREEIAEIRVMFAEQDKPPTCPRCECTLSVETPDLEELKGKVYVK